MKYVLMDTKAKSWGKYVGNMYEPQHDISKAKRYKTETDAKQDLKTFDSPQDFVVVEVEN